MQNSAEIYKTQIPGFHFGIWICGQCAEGARDVYDMYANVLRQKNLRRRQEKNFFRLKALKASRECRQTLGGLKG
jgi:hypothetical protein